jgi:hypothetical protein
MSADAWTKTEVLEAFRVVAGGMGLTVQEALSRLHDGGLYTPQFAARIAKLKRLLATVGGGDVDLQAAFEAVHACRICGAMPAIDPRVPASRLQPKCDCWQRLLDKVDAS